MKTTVGILITLIASFAPAFGKDSALSMSADEALQRLRDGNVRFVNGTSEHANLTALRRSETATRGQKPFATILGCSDSRAPVEHIFDQGVGDLFTIRVAGNVADTDEIGSVEYGVGHLETSVLVVLGHTGCGAVTAVAKNAEVHGSIPALVDNISPAVERVRRRTGQKTADDAFIGLCIRENVFQSIEDLLERSPELREHVRERKVKIVGALYHLKDGHVEWLGEHPDQSALANGKGGHWESLTTQSLLVAVLMGIALTAAFFLFVSDRRFFQSLRIRGRLIASFVVFAASSVVLALFAIGIGERIHSASEAGIVLGFPGAVLCIGALIYAHRHAGALDDYIERLRIHFKKSQD